MANVLGSIEVEPMTLSEGQLSQAREVAADVVKKLEPREASALFIEGLEHPMKEMDIKNGEQVEMVGSCIEKVEIIDEKACKCVGSTAIVESPDQITHPNQPLSAPF